MEYNLEKKKKQWITVLCTLTNTILYINSTSVFKKAIRWYSVSLKKKKGMQILNFYLKLIESENMGTRLGNPYFKSCPCFPEAYYSFGTTHIPKY